MRVIEIFEIYRLESLAPSVRRIRDSGDPNRGINECMIPATHQRRDAPAICSVIDFRLVIAL